MNRRWINTKVEFIWDGTQYVEQSAEGYWYDGEMALCYDFDNSMSIGGGEGSLHLVTTGDGGHTFYLTAWDAGKFLIRQSTAAGEGLVCHDHNWGIGTASPGVYKFMVYHTGGNSYPVARFHGDHAGGGTRIVFSHTGNSNTNSYGFVCGGTDTGTDEKFGIVRFDGDAGTYEALPYMTFDNTGNVGIGTTGPVENLHIAQSDSDKSYIQFTNSATGHTATDGCSIGLGDDESLVIYQREANDIILGTSAATRMTIKSGGNVGIGTGSPDGKLHVHTATAGSVTASGNADDLVVENSAHGGITILTPDASEGAIYFGTPSDSLGAIMNWAHNDNQMNIGTHNADGFLSFRTDVYSERMRIDKDGKVGIGTTNPSYLFHAEGPANSIVARIGSPGFAGFQFKMLSSTTSGTYLHEMSSGGSEGFHFKPSGVSTMVMTKDGNVGIGTTAPSTLLEVNGAVSKSSGSFKIDHPLPSMKDTHHLVHSFTESPRADLIYRDKVALVDGSAIINIDTVAGMTEGTFVLLCDNVQCFTSNESDWSAVKGSVSGNILTIECEDSSSTADVAWMVIGDRQDEHIMDTNWTDENGKPIIEPEKPIIETEEEALENA